MPVGAGAPNRMGDVLQIGKKIAGKPAALWVGFLLVHAWLGYLGLTHPALPFGDVTLVYRPWVENALAGNVVGISQPWVYPIVALLPMLAAMVLGPDLYAEGWLLVVVVTNATVLAFILSRGRPGGSGSGIRMRAAWWWLLFLFLLGPVALGRIDVMTVAIAMAGLLLAQSRPGVAGMLLAIATWIKVWPAALAAVVVLTVRKRGIAALAAVGTGVVIAGIALLLGSGANLLGFVSQQTGRGLQIEAPVSTIWMWLAYADPQAWHVYYDTGILTFQVSGPGSEAASALMTPLLVVALAAVLGLGYVIVRSGARATHVLPPLSLAVVTALIVFNKVGSPQFVLWLAAPIVLGLVSMGRRFRLPATLAAVIAGLTQIIYPFAYDGLLNRDPVVIWVLTLRNLLMIAMFVLAIVLVWKSRRVVGRKPAAAIEPAVEEPERRT
jgi:hypothetical protein